MSESDKMKLSIVIPTLNSEATLGECLEAIMRQNFPRDSFEVVIADAGSVDRTLEIAHTYGVDTIATNPLRTGEAGKAAGIKAARGELIALVDSDNIMEAPDWISRMVAPFDDPEIVGSEPIEYTARKEDPALTRYFSMLGMTDPFCLFNRNYDRWSAVTGKWTGLQIEQQDKGDWIKLSLTPENLPTMGANGFVFRRSMLEHLTWEPYFFDIDIVYQAVARGMRHIAKVKIGIVHLYCVRMREFANKQRRRIHDFLYYSTIKQRTYPWERHKRSSTLLFALATILTLPLLVQMVRGWWRQRDMAWLYHVPVCWLTLWIYGWAVVRKMLGFKQAPLRRDNWQTHDHSD